MRVRPMAIDLFCGVGGMSLGFERAGIDVVAAFDSNPICVQSYGANFPETVVCSIDLGRTPSDKIMALAGIQDGELGVLFGGPPCQGFSLIGRRDSDDSRNDMVLEFARLVRELEPKYFVMENVVGLMQGNGAQILDSFVRRIKRSGYSIVEPIEWLNASDFGVPQDRKRVFVLGYQKELHAPRYPSPLQLGSTSGTPNTTVVEAIGDLFVIDERRELIMGGCFSGVLGRASEYARKLRQLPSQDKLLLQKRSNYRGKLTGCKYTTHTHQTVRRFSLVTQGAMDRVSRCKRLALDGVAPTLRAGTGPLRGSFTAARPIHPLTDRYITVREAARLHSIPDWFELHPTIWHGYMQVGNSVPPLLAAAVANEIVSALEKN